MVPQLILVFLFSLVNPISCGFINSGSPNVNFSTDCAIRNFLYEYGWALQPRHHPFRALADALQISVCNKTLAKFLEPFPPEPKWIPPRNYPTKSSSCIYYTDPENGDDSNSGTFENPFATIERTIDATRKNRAKNPSQSIFCEIYLRGGLFQIDSTVILNSDDSNLKITNYNGEHVIVSGAYVLPDLAWKPYLTKPVKNVSHANRNNVNKRVIPGQNYLDTIFLGTYPSELACAAAFQKFNSMSQRTLHSWTWFSKDYSNSSFAKQCFGVITPTWAPIVEGNVISGRNEYMNIWAADLSDSKVDIERDGILYGLRVNGKRGIRARYPNGDPEISMQFQSKRSWIPSTQDQWMDPTPPKSPAKTVNIYPSDYPDVEWPWTDPGGDDTWSGEGDFGVYHVGIGGGCDKVDPPFGYWCSPKTVRDMFPHRHPSGLRYDQYDLPHSRYHNATGAIVHAFHIWHWFTAQLVVGEDTGSQFTFSDGGEQGAEGFDAGSEWYIENVFEELDSPREWFYHRSNSTLYYFHNDSSLKPPSFDDVFAVTRTKVLFRAEGSQGEPLKNFVLSGIDFRDTAYTFMDVHGLPSGGDWALEKKAAVMIGGSVNATIEDCRFSRLDGNGIFLDGFNRHAKFLNNDFEWIGATAMAAWGHSSGNATFPKGVGPDGRDGNQPRFTLVEGNLGREIGIWQKQSALWFQAVTCCTTFRRNIFFNGPRAAINLNDGFGGANQLYSNLLFNAVRETTDHGVFNSWDRLPYITNVRTGKPSVIPAKNHIHHNIFMGTYNTQQVIDTDDGSSYYEVYNNFFPYGENGMKSTYGGHDRRDYRNVYAFVDSAWGYGIGDTAGMNDAFFNNTVLLMKHWIWSYFSSCDNETFGFNDTDIHDNALFNNNGSIKVCGQPLQEYQKKGHDKGTTISVYPSDEELITMARRVLEL